MHKSLKHLICMVLTIPLVCSQMTIQDINFLRVEIRSEIGLSESNFLAKLVRLIFQDCGGPSEDDNDGILSICNGCINNNNLANTGLKDEAVDELNWMYSMGEWNQKMTRADFWAAAATIAIEYAQELDSNSYDELPTIPYYFGRRDCGETAQTEKDKSFPAASDGWDGTSQWFSDNLQFSTQETVAIIGAHTLGDSHLQFSGYSDLPWVRSQNELHVLNNQYYKNLLNTNLNWAQSQSNDGLWEYKDENNQILMLNSDISLVKDIDDYSDVFQNTGKVNCTFNECPQNDDTFVIVEEYATSNQIWLDDFAKAFEKLIITGYNPEQLIKIVPTTTTTAQPDIITTKSKTTKSKTTITSAPQSTSVTSNEQVVTTVEAGVDIPETLIDVSDFMEFSTTDHHHESTSTTQRGEGILDELNDFCGEYCGVVAVVSLIGVVIISLVLLCVLWCKRKEEEEDFNPASV